MAFAPRDTSGELQPPDGTMLRGAQISTREGIEYVIYGEGDLAVLQRRDEYWPTLFEDERLIIAVAGGLALWSFDFNTAHELTYVATTHHQNPDAYVSIDSVDMKNKRLTAQISDDPRDSKHAVQLMLFLGRNLAGTGLTMEVSTPKRQKFVLES